MFHTFLNQKNSTLNDVIENRVIKRSTSFRVIERLSHHRDVFLFISSLSVYNRNDYDTV